MPPNTEKIDIIPPARIFIDEAGHLDLRELEGERELRPYVLCGVCIPTMYEAETVAILPKGGDGELLKATSSGLSPDAARRFVEEILRREIGISLLFISSGHAESLNTVSEMTRLVNKNRSVGSKTKKPPHVIYALSAKDVAIWSWGRLGLMQKEMPTFLDVVFDNFSLPNQFRRWFRKTLVEKCATQDITIRQVTWASEADEPLLLVPDLLAGIVHRHVTRQDCPDAFSMLLEASKKGTIRIEDGASFGGSKTPETRPE